MYNRILVAIDASPDSPDDSLDRTIQFARWPAATVYLLHVARGHIIPTDISAGAGFGVRSAEDDVDVRERQVVQNAVDQLAAAGIEVHGELIEATEHDVAGVIIQRAKELEVDIIVLGYQHHRGSVSPSMSSGSVRIARSCLPGPPSRTAGETPAIAATALGRRLSRTPTRGGPVQYFLNGYRKGDPRIRPAADGRTDDQPDLPEEVDVLIVGSGPAGLLLARSARPSSRTSTPAWWSGHRARCEVGRADGVNCRTVETFEAFGLAER